MKRKILLVEDSSDSREVLQVLLHLYGFDVLAAADGEEGLRLAAAEPPDLILTDLNMPKLNGIEMIRQLRAQPEFERVPIIATSAYTDGIAAQAIKAGANKNIVKPVDFEVLLATISTLLGPS